MLLTLFKNYFSQGIPGRVRYQRTDNVRPSKYTIILLHLLFVIINYYIIITVHYSLGSKGGAVVRALVSHQCGPGSNPSVDTICGLSLLLVLSLAPRGFSPGTPVFPSPQKPTFPNSNSTRNQVDEEPLSGYATSKSLFIYFIYFIYLPSLVREPDNKINNVQH